MKKKIHLNRTRKYGFVCLEISAADAERNVTELFAVE